MLSVEPAPDKNTKKLPSHQSSSSCNPTLLKIGQVSALPIMLTGLLDPQWVHRSQCQHRRGQQEQQQQQSQSTSSVMSPNCQITNNVCEHCRQSAGDESNKNDENKRKLIDNQQQQPIRFLAYKVNDKFREILTPLPNKKFYSPLPQSQADEHRNSDESSA